MTFWKNAPKLLETLLNVVDSLNRRVEAVITSRTALQFIPHPRDQQNRPFLHSVSLLQSQFQNQGNRLIPDAAEERALMYQRMFEGQSFYEKLNNVIYYDLFVPEEERHASALSRNKEALKAELGLWEAHLQKSPGSFLAGSSFSLADVVVFPTVAYLFRFGLSAGRYPKMGEYYALLKDRPSIKASWPPHWLENPKGHEALKDF
uniref:Glutathione S-transferase rho n=1 Tax=Oryzias sinensis TaxID=183150 RepID=A0A8C7WS81_9TELE